MRYPGTIGIRTKTEYVNKPIEYRDNSPYWRIRLLQNAPIRFYKHNQHGLKSPIFYITKISIVPSPQKFLDEGVLHTETAIMIVGEPDSYPEQESPEKK